MCLCRIGAQANFTQLLIMQAAPGTGECGVSWALPEEPIQLGTDLSGHLILGPPYHVQCEAYGQDLGLRSGSQLAPLQGVPGAGS